MRRRVLAVVLLLVAGLAGATVAGSSGAEQASAPPADQLVAPDGTESYVWPYTSRHRSTEGRTLALNVVVHGEPDRVSRAFTARSDENWSQVDPNATVSVSPWRPAHGSVRYSYVSGDHGGSGEWIPPAYQLAVGTYFGERTHIRAYPSASGNWTALQAHTEYWDWFRLRHTVTGVEPGAAFVERDLADEPFVADVSRATHGNTGGGSDGSWLVVEFASAALLAAAVPLTTRRLQRADLAVAAAPLAVVVGVRTWGLAAEAVAPGVNPKLFVAIGYPVLAAGPPLLVARFARGRPPVRAGVLALGSLTIATVLDLGFVGVADVPARIVQHRVALAAALGVVAFGAAENHRRVVAAGLAAWAAALAAPLFGLI
ncbi:hypothetical protein [Halolamina salifodinae]|uniref:Uncharacterized protein n=1 Tax=Halolamina salifodinae TaxID=1202767 RepID=A0A8T4GS86_9EURY|nr:hypothetical protein [Halolamina salifodinae]MBP1985991.1 hypothetical protein [Halolamina salifodinae]